MNLFSSQFNYLATSSQSRLVTSLLAFHFCSYADEPSEKNPFETRVFDAVMLHVHVSRFSLLWLNLLFISFLHLTCSTYVPVSPYLIYLDLADEKYAARPSAAIMCKYASQMSSSG